ncbi:Ras GTPase [Arthrobotrys musiformis]|uniref:Ras GTPase n=1 Tax=Arthrobotrys musiformis TaxID=47236 RepID=A0AAV9WCB7_9PEZI
MQIFPGGKQAQRFVLQHHRILLLGSRGVGKWSFIIKYMGYRSCFLDFDDVYQRDQDHRKQCVIDDQVTLVEILPIYDETGDYPALKRQYIEESDGFIFMYSIGSQKSYQELSGFYQQVREVKGPGYIPMVVVGNKCDLITDREVSSQEGRELADSFGAVFYEASARNDIYIDWSVHELIRRIRDPLRSMEPDGIGAQGNLGLEQRRRRYSLRAAWEWIGDFVKRVVRQ